MERAVADQATALAALGWEVTIVTPVRPSEVAPRGISIENVPWPSTRSGPGRPRLGVNYWIWVARARRVLRRRCPADASIYTHGGASGVLRGLRRDGAATSVANPHGMEEFHRAGLLRAAARLIGRHLARGARYADIVIATDEALVSRVRSNIGCGDHQVRMIPNAVDVTRLDRVAREGFESSLDADLVSVGRLVPNKGYDLLLEAIRSIELRSGRRLRWVHFGRGHAKGELVRDAAATPPVQLVVVEGADDSVVQATIESVGRFVQPSRYEGSSLTTLEAMARGAICVGTPVGGIPEKIIDGETGFLAASATVDALADAIERSFDADYAMGSRARDRVLSTYDLPAVAEQLSACLEGSSRRRAILQVARHIGPGAGVAQVVHSLEKSFAGLGVSTSRFTLRDTGMRWRTQVSGNVLKKIALLIEVVWFSIAGTIAVQHIRRRFPTLRILVHGDPIGGDVYVNHGLLKEVMRGRSAERKWRFPLNPMHWFTLARDEIRYRGTRQRAIVCLTDGDRATLVDLYPAVQVPIHVVPNGVDLDAYASLDEELREQTRLELGLRAGATALLFVGHEYDRKGLYIAIDSLSQLSSDFILVVVGGSQEMVAKGQLYSAARGVDRRVKFVGATSDPRPYYAATDIVVLPSAYETGPLVLLEALASGRMVVMTRTGLAPQVIVEGRNGEIVDRVPASVARGINQSAQLLARDRKAVVEDCRRSVETFGWDAIAMRYLQVIEESR
ncbi:glycosyltransferase family 4 protein [Microbacterium trichothecenolyticum]|uniref:glycosyltransferase family 4 protein n=1 Tax=Microbacterium trichothecenolyticum TaxID=69370 RepID=UPI0035BE1555